MTDKRKVSVLLTTLLTSFIPLAVYPNEDISDKIWQKTQYNQKDNQKKNKADLKIPDIISKNRGTSSAVNHRQILKIESGPKGIGQALYLAINDQQWRDIRNLVVIYQQLPEHNPLLVDFAQGSLARLEGNLALSASYYEKILRQQPNSTRIKLELARVYFEDHKNREAEQMLDGLSQQHQLPAMVLKNIDNYLKTITTRTGWHGSLSLGYGYDDNINMSSEQEPTCTFTIKGKCIIVREIPKAIKEWGNTYSAKLSRRYQIAGHHGIFGRGLIHGKNYRHYHDENENTLQLISGYHYKSKNHDISFGPLFEYKLRAGSTEYHAVGAKIEWQWAITAQTNLNVELGHKQLTYQQLYRWKNGTLSSSYFGMSHAINDKFILFGGSSWVYRDNSQPAARYQQWGVNAGIAGQLYSGINGSLFITLKKQHFAAYNALLGAKRRESEQIYTASIKFPAAKIMGMTPSLTFIHRRNHSNVSWLYSYDKNEVRIQLEKYF
ncbi:DUF560 domain-containing protein [Xenorhabdus sp. Vera]|uniref:porin family protein n=1 Tax=Xenorhabdus koppenhoeferi TaxID=351659 RepID=UPI0019C8FD31|nr:porin family protein [Xenorhabdus sp. Vera]MBD2809693.1 DUF560 domain-containing protein [Xenorhabdus sp. Vera]